MEPRRNKSLPIPIFAVLRAFGFKISIPAEAVNFYKQRKIIRTAQWYLMEKHLSDCRCRFDVIEVYAMTAGAWKVRQIEGAFEM